MTSKKANTIKIKVEEIPFSYLSDFNDNGEEVLFDAGDEGRFKENLYSEIGFDLLINGLSKKNKKAFELRKERGLSSAEIAERLGSKTRTVEQRFRRGHEKIREKIRRVQENQLKKFGKTYE